MHGRDNDLGGSLIIHHGEVGAGSAGAELGSEGGNGSLQLSDVGRHTGDSVMFRQRGRAISRGRGRTRTGVTSVPHVDGPRRVDRERTIMRRVCALPLEAGAGTRRGEHEVHHRTLARDGLRASVTHGVLGAVGVDHEALDGAAAVGVLLDRKPGERDRAGEGVVGSAGTAEAGRVVVVGPVAMHGEGLLADVGKPGAGVAGVPRALRRLREQGGLAFVGGRAWTRTGVELNLSGGTSDGIVLASYKTYRSRSPHPWARRRCSGRR